MVNEFYMLEKENQELKKEIEELRNVVFEYEKTFEKIIEMLEGKI